MTEWSGIRGKASNFWLPLFWFDYLFATFFEIELI